MPQTTAIGTRQERQKAGEFLAGMKLSTMKATVAWVRRQRRSPQNDPEVIDKVVEAATLAFSDTFALAEIQSRLRGVRES